MSEQRSKTHLINIFYSQILVITLKLKVIPFINLNVAVKFSAVVGLSERNERDQQQTIVPIATLICLLL
jgi:hypothetical protein